MAISRKRTDMSRILDGSMSPIRVILWLSWPVLIEQLMTSLVNYADTAMVGALGAYATASISISNSPNMLINGAIMALGTGITSQVAMSVGAGNYDMAKKFVRHALVILSTFGVFLWALLMGLHRAIPTWMGAGEDIIDYAAQYNLIFNSGRLFAMATILMSAALRGAGDTRTPLIANTTVNLLNVCGNFLLIQPSRNITLFGHSFRMWGAGMGVAGAAAASAFAMTVGGVIMIIILFTRETPIKLSLKDSFKVEGPVLKRLISVSFPALLERICTSGAGIIVSSSVASLGTEYIAANSLQLTAESISFMPAMAFSNAATTLMGQSLGAGRPQLAKKYTWTTIGFSMIVMCFMGAALYVFAAPVLGFFTPDEQVISIGVDCLHIIAFAQPIQVFTWVLAGALRGAGDTKWAFYITAISTWCVRVLGSVLCLRVFGLSLPSVIACAFAENTVRGILMWLRFRSGKWEHAKALK